MSGGAADTAAGGAAEDLVLVALKNEDGSNRSGKAIFAEERAKLKEALFHHHIQASADTFITVVCHCTAYRRLVGALFWRRFETCMWNFTCARCVECDDILTGGISADEAARGSEEQDFAREAIKEVMCALLFAGVGEVGGEGGGCADEVAGVRGLRFF